MKRIGIDLGGSKIEGVLISGNGEILSRKRIPTIRSEGYEAILNRIVSLVRELIDNGSVDYTIGICTPGTISPKSGMIKNSNTACLIGKPFQQDLEDKLDHTILMDNDANCFALAEAILGAGQGFNTVFGVIMGTGVGGGIVINKQVHRGAGLIAGEWGHHKIDPNGPKCYCGNRGCVETFISGPALEHQWTSITGKSLTLEKIVNEKDIPGYNEWKEEFLTHFGLALSNVINILDPDVVVLGGGVSNISFLYSDGLRYVEKYSFSDYPNTPIVQNKLGDSAGVIGAAYLGEWS